MQTPGLRGDQHGLEATILQTCEPTQAGSAPQGSESPSLRGPCPEPLRPQTEEAPTPGARPPGSRMWVPSLLFRLSPQLLRLLPRYLGAPLSTCLSLNTCVINQHTDSVKEAVVSGTGRFEGHFLEY